MSAWQVRKEGAPEVYSLPSAAAVLAALRDGNFVPADEVRGPGEADFQPLEQHPAFADAALDVEPPPGETADETHLDMNPLIDVCLVLLIFFILTITYASLERALEVPEDTPEDKGAPKMHINELKDRVFMVVVKMDGEKPVFKIGIPGSMKEVPANKDAVFKEIETIINTTGRKEMLVDIDKDVPWGVELEILLDAAKGNKVHSIINNQRRGR
ncbi:MAG: biopolymer transporter ExbD [Planctomycetes bacterium]|nr:biopolymer transporter ExbD [Planctomycetota bacterium]